MLYRFGSTAFARSERKQIVTESLLHALDRIKRRRVIRLVERKPDHAGRIHIGAINALFMTAGGDPPEYSAAAKAAIDRGYMTMHPSGGYLSFTQAEICSRSQMAACCEGGRLRLEWAFVALELSRSDRSPSIVPPGNDQDVYLVLDDRGL